MQATTNSCDFTDVTLAVHDGPIVCRHYQTGFCKFGESCRKQHVKEICQMNNCNLKICTQRHPKVCKYFKHHQLCKFGDSCCYRHDIVEPRGCLLEKQLEALNATVAKMSAVIHDLEEKVARLENVSMLEIERDTLSDNSLQLSVPDEDRAEVSNPQTSRPLPTDEREVKCEHSYINGSTGLVVPTFGDPCPLHPCCTMCEITAASEESRPPRFCNFQSDPSCPRPCSGSIFNVDISSARGHSDWKVLDFILGTPSLLEFRL